MNGVSGSYWKTRVGKPHFFTATYCYHDERYDPNQNRRNEGKKIRYMFLTNVVSEEGVFFRRHIWLPYGKRFRKMGLRTGDTVRFRAKVGTYTKIPTEAVNGTWVYSDDVRSRQVKLDLNNISDFEVLEKRADSKDGEQTIA